MNLMPRAPSSTVGKSSASGIRVAAGAAGDDRLGGVAVEGGEGLLVALGVADLDRAARSAAG